MKKKRGFTLVELLAVIVILAVIALIATPTILKTISGAREESQTRSIENVLKAAENYVVESMLKGELKVGENIYADVVKKLKGKLPDSGSIYANSEGQVAFALVYSDNCYTKKYIDEIKDIKNKKINPNLTEDTDAETKSCLAPIDYLIDNTVSNFNSPDEKMLHGELVKGTIESITIEDHINVPNGAKSYDVSAGQNGSIIAWYLDSDNNGFNELYIGQEGGVKANPNSKGLFSGLTNVKSIDLEHLDTSTVYTMSFFFSNCQSLTDINLEYLDTSNVTTMAFMFQNCDSLTTIDLSTFNTDKLTIMHAMFQQSDNLETLDLSVLNTENVTDMAMMFHNCQKLKNLNMKGVKTHNVTDMSWMFTSCKSLEELDLSSFDTSKVTNMGTMFQNTIKLKTLNISGFKTHNVTDMGYMFTGIQSLEELDLSNFDTSKVTNMGYMFDNCKFKTLNISGFKTPNVTNMGYMFNNFQGLEELDLSNAEFNKVTDFTNMVSNSSVKTITVKNSEAKSILESSVPNITIQVK